MQSRAVKAAMRDLYGGPDVVSVRDIDKPSPGESDVLVRVIAASVNRADLDGLYPRWQFTRLFLGLRRPKEAYRRLGIDVAGVVETVGPKVASLKAGDDVFSDLSAFGGGAFAEYVCAPERAFAAMPATMSHENAATLPHSAIIAIHAFRPRGGRSLAAGMRVLVVGASGNVGPFVVQLAKSRGADVTAVVGGDKSDLARSLGADQVVDYRTTDYTRPAEPYDWIVDVSAHHPIRRWVRALRPDGVYVAFAGSAWWLFSSALLGPIISRLTGKRLGLAFVGPFRPDDVEELRKVVAKGVLRPVIDRRFSLDEVVEALRYVDEGQARGKVIVTPGSSPLESVG